MLLPHEDNPIPSKIARSGERDVHILWNNGHESTFDGRYLRLQCPCASCVDEMTGMRVLRDEEVSDTVSPATVELVGRYAIRIWWNDGHSSGIYTFEFLRDLCPCDTCRTGEAS
jgi:ATP-binding protein involved in chromosome partitioning